MKELIKAIREKDYSLIDKIFSTKTYEEEDHDFPLIMRVISTEDPLLIEHFLKHKDKFNIQAKDSYEYNALNRLAGTVYATLAVISYSDEKEPDTPFHIIGQLLLDAGVCLDSLNQFGQDPLMNAINTDKEELIKVFLNSIQMTQEILDRSLNYNDEDKNKVAKYERFKINYEKNLMEKNIINKETNKPYKI